MVVDNYDSFVYNLVQYLGQLGAEPVVCRNDAIGVADALAMEPDGVLVSPGPGRPEDAGVSVELIRAFSGHVPVLGVCLGHQAIGYAFGGRVVRAPQLLHGKTSQVLHDGTGIFEGVNSPFTATRYHSLVVERASLGDDLEVNAWAEDGTVMGLRHRRAKVDGVQFHPEAVLTAGGYRLIANWLVSCGLAGALAAVPTDRQRPGGP